MIKEDTDIAQLANAIAHQAFLDNWEYWVVLGLLVLVVGFTASWLGSYASKRAEVTAAKADRDEILRQLKENTRVTETVRSIVSLAEWSERERRQLKRAKLEELMVAAHRSAEWMESEIARYTTLREVTDPDPLSPLPLMVTLGKLFFPELRDRVSAFSDACADFHIALLKINGEVIDAKFETLAAMPAGTSESESTFKVHQAALAFSPRKLALVMKHHAIVVEKLRDLAEASAARMAELISVPTPG